MKYNTLNTLYLSLFLCLFLQQQVQANIAEPPRQYIGQLTGNTGIEAIEVSHELLNLDFRPLLENKPIQIKAAYTLEVETIQQNVPLIFIANNLENNDFRIVLDGQVIEGDTTSIKHAPEQWFPPETIQWRDQMLPFEYQNKGFIVFYLPMLTVGQHFLEVSYLAKPSEAFEHPYVSIWEFVYILQPTTKWKRFQNLDLQVFIPEGWEYYSNVPLEKKGSLWVGTWKDLPAQHLAISCNQKTTWLQVKNTVIRVGYLLLFLFTVLSLLFIIIRRRILYKKGPLLEGLAIIAIVLVGAVVLNMIYFKQTEWWYEQLGWQANPYLGYGSGYIIILTVPVTAIILSIIVPVVIHFMKKYLVKKYQQNIAKA